MDMDVDMDDKNNIISFKKSLCFYVPPLSRNIVPVPFSLGA
jgi:hypothetical protein